MTADVPSNDLLLAAVTVRRSRGGEQPLVRWTCDDASSGGRGACTVLEVWPSPHGHILFRPAGHISAERAATRPDGNGPVRFPATASLLETMIRNGGPEAIVNGALLCRHRIAALSLELLCDDIRQRRAVRRIAASDWTAET